MNKRAEPQTWFRVAVLTAALVAILFLATGAALWHHDAPGSAATCPICAAAHLPALRSAPAEAVPTHFVVVWMIAPELRFAPPAPETLQPPPRGPPV
jgi:hypothetical protein